MKLKAFPLFVVVLSLFLILTGCQAAGEANEVPAEAATPVEVTESFYEWYFDYIGEPGSEEMKNPLVDHAYRSSPYLTAVYITKVDTILSSFDGGGYDPFLQAQDIPQGFTVEEDYTAENDACAVVHQQFGDTIHDLTMDLVKDEGTWKINTIRRGNPRTPDVALPAAAMIFFRAPRTSPMSWLWMERFSRSPVAVVHPAATNILWFLRSPFVNHVL